MTLHDHVFYVVPAQAVRVARTAFPKGNLYLLNLASSTPISRLERVGETLRHALNVLVDTGYIDADILPTSIAGYGIDVLGPLAAAC